MFNLHSLGLGSRDRRQTTPYRVGNPRKHETRGGVKGGFDQLSKSIDARAVANSMGTLFFNALLSD